LSGNHYENILGYQIATDSIEGCVKKIISWIESGEGTQYFVCANPHSICLAQNDGLSKTALQSADLITPDGIGVVIASKILGGTLRNRVTGSDIFAGINAYLNSREGSRIFFLGSTEKTLKRIKEKMAGKYPRIKHIQTYSPPFKEEFNAEDNTQMIRAINEFVPHVLWVGMTAPKQERWIYQNKDLLNVRSIGAVGAVFDFFTGNVKRSHPFYLKAGLEWLPRLLQEPRRLWRRNFISTPKFLFKVILQRFNLNI